MVGREGSLASEIDFARRLSQKRSTRSSLRITMRLGMPTHYEFDHKALSSLDAVHSSTNMHQPPPRFARMRFLEESLDVLNTAL
jgi:hypothetical protein